jgi:hypothetical protein
MAATGTIITMGATDTAITTTIIMAVGTAAIGLITATDMAIDRTTVIAPTTAVRA